MTGNDVIASALRKIGVLASGEPLDAAAGADALVVLNDMLDSWNAERLIIFAIARQVFNLVAGQQVYQMGQGAPDFNVVRPPKIERVGIINLANPQLPAEYRIAYVTAQLWAGVPIKQIQSNLPQEVWDDQNFPFRNLTYWPIPQVQVQTAIYTWTALAAFADLVTDYTFPPAYAQAIKENLAIKLASEFGGKPEAIELVAPMAVESKAVVKRMNIQPVTLTCDRGLAPTGGGYYNIYTDQ